MKRLDWFKLFLDVVVVFVGVTAGFYLNNWQTEQVDRGQEQKYLSGFLVDVESNIAELENAIARDSITLDSLRIILHMVKAGTIDTHTALQGVGLVTTVSVETLHNGTYQSIVNTGNFDLLRNHDLKTFLVEYNIGLAEFALISAKRFDWYDRFTLSFLTSKYHIYSRKFVDPSFIYSAEYENMLAIYYFPLQNYRYACEHVLEKSEKLKEMLLKEIR